MENFFSDAHCDTISRIYENGESLFQNSGQMDLERMQSVGLGLQFFAVFVKPCKGAYEKACNMIMKYHEECAKNLDIVAKVRSKWDYEDGKINAVLTVEGGHVLEGNPERVRELWDMGVRVMTLTWNGESELTKGQKGLSSFGGEVVREMEKLGMFIDVSHLNEDGFWDVIKHTKRKTPILATHSNCREVCEHKRNLNDEQIVAIIRRNGYIGLNLYPPFLGGDSLGLITKHIRHILKLGGEDCLGLGCDWDGVDRLPRGIEGVEDMGKLGNLIEKEVGKEVAEKICGKNLQRFFR